MKTNEDSSLVSLSKLTIEQRQSLLAPNKQLLKVNEDSSLVSFSKSRTKQLLKANEDSFL